MRITISDIKKCLEEDEEFFINYLNNFKGDNVYEKFTNILKNWEKNISYTINFRIKEKKLIGIIIQRKVYKIYIGLDRKSVV